MGTDIPMGTPTSIWIIRGISMIGIVRWIGILASGRLRWGLEGRLAAARPH